MADDYIDFGDFARKELGMQCQYATYFIHGLAGYPQLCGDIRMYNPLQGTYHMIKIHRDDTYKLKKRVDVWEESIGTTMFPGNCKSCLYRNRHYEPTFMHPFYCTKCNNYITNQGFQSICKGGCEDYELQNKPSEVL
jgi:hypothetical protein